MVDVPSLVGYRPEEAETLARDLGLTICWLENEAPRWLSPHHEARVGRQRLLPDGRVELLRVLIPCVAAGEEPCGSE